MTPAQAIAFLEEAADLLTEIDDRATLVAAERRAGKFGDTEIEFRIRLWVEKFSSRALEIQPEQQFQGGYVLAPLPAKKGQG